jgi:tripartite-type tricarboxylate transporter receptor subunit TctC
MKTTGALLAGFLLTTAIQFTHAQPAAKTAGKTYPDRPVRTLVGLPAGGSVDIVVRGLSAKLTEAFGQSFVVDNRPGAGGVVAFDILSSAAPDGHTLGAVGGTSILYPLLYKSRYDIARDFAAVAQLTAQGYVLVIHPSLPANSATDFVQYLKANPDKVNYASSGIGGPLHMSGELFKLSTGTRMTHVPYKGTALVYADLLGGQVHACFPTIITSLQHIRSGRLRALAVTTPNRVQAVPSVPTFDEAGVKGMVVVNWYGVMAPKKTPPPIIDRLVTEINKAMHSPEMMKGLVADGSEAVSGSPAELAALIKAENERWSRVVRAVGMKVDLR